MSIASDGSVEFSGVNTYSGRTVIGNSATLVLSGGNALSDSGAVTVTSPRTLILKDNETIGSLDGVGSVNLSDYTLTTGGNNSSTDFSGIIYGAGGITKVGSGTFTLSGANTYTGTTTVSAGVLSISADENLGSGNLALNGGTLSSVNATFTLDNNITLETDGGSMSASGSSNTMTLSGIISGNGTLTTSGDATIVLSGNNTFSGNATISSGILVAGHTQALGSTAGHTTVNSGSSLKISDDISIAENLELRGSGQSDAGALMGGSNSALSGTVTFLEDTGIGVASGDLTISGVMTGRYTINKFGSGNLILTGDNRV